mgnify:CR=1 FL=1
MITNKNDENYVYYLVGQNIKKARRKKGLSIVKFAQLTNYSEGYIKNIESPNYYQTFSLGTLWKFAQVLDVDIKEFFNPIK